MPQIQTVEQIVDLRVSLTKDLQQGSDLIVNPVSRHVMVEGRVDRCVVISRFYLLADFPDRWCLCPCWLHLMEWLLLDRLAVYYGMA